MLFEEREGCSSLEVSRLFPFSPSSHTQLMALSLDSITRMHFEASNFLLEGLSFQYKEIYTTTQPLFVYKVLETIIKNPSHAVLTLNPLHPAVEDLLQEAGVGKERIDAPVLSMFRSDFLGSDRESIDTACAENGVSRSLFVFVQVTFS